MKMVQNSKARKRAGKTPGAERRSPSPNDASPVQAKSINPGRHESQCTICAHPQRQEIEREFVNWGSAGRIAIDYMVSRDSLHRHAHAVGLFAKRQRNIRSALERIIEKAGEVEVNATAVVSAISAYARINSAGQWVERTESVNLDQLFERMTSREMEAYAHDGTLPEWFKTTVGATATDSREGEDA